MRGATGAVVAVVVALGLACGEGAEETQGPQGSQETSGGDGPRCGDGLVDPGEVCDDGVNDGAYLGCMPFCQALGPFCGNRLVDPEEVCDDGVNDGAYGGCMPGCEAAAPGCGDGMVASTREPEGCYGCCRHEYCDDAAPQAGSRCVECQMRAPAGLRGCDLASSSAAVTVTTPLGTTELAVAFFGEVYGSYDHSEAHVITGTNLVFAAAPPARPEDLVAEAYLGGGALVTGYSYYNGDFCYENSVPLAGRWEGSSLSLLRHRLGTDMMDVDATLVIDAIAGDWEDTQPGSSDPPRLKGHFEGALSGAFEATYCETLFVDNTSSPG
jgi:cysteine-rich repeat protein